jgi:hypothetical protein
MSGARSPAHEQLGTLMAAGVPTAVTFSFFHSCVACT